MPRYPVKVGIIGGTGLDDHENQVFTCKSVVQQKDASNDFGYPSSNISHGNISGIDVVLLSRHGEGHVTSPSAINYRANIEALRLAGCTHILATTACGSLIESIHRGQLVIPDSFIDRTYRRIGTFYDGTSKEYKGVCHMPMEPAFDPYTSEILFNATKRYGFNAQKGGTIVTIEGPRFSSKAESNAFRQWGGHLINMTTFPEVCLAKEAGMLYSAIAIATDYDCWRENDTIVHAADVVAAFKSNVVKVKSVLLAAVEVIGMTPWDEHIDSLKTLIKTSNVSEKGS